MTFTHFRSMTAGTLAAMVVTVLFQTSNARAAEKGPLRVNFEKCFKEDGGPFGGHYEGTVDGDFGVGTVIFTFASLATVPADDPNNVVLQFSGVYTFTTARGVISAFAAGIDNLRSGSGHDVLNGVVVAGPYLGAQVQVRAVDYNEGACSRGTITITPSK